MRLWHIDIIPYLPNSQLVAQWRELNSIYKKQDKHILINYIYNYDKQYLFNYTFAVIEELSTRNIKIKKWDNYDKYFIDLVGTINSELKYPEHDNEYLTICYYNLKEKYLRHQKDFSTKLFTELTNFYLTKYK